MSTNDIVRRLLVDAGYTTFDAKEFVCFEDDSVLGFVREFVSAEDLVSGWRSAQDAFLEEHAVDLRRDRNKSWNIYAIFLTSVSADEANSRELIAIEEDFRSTRKIARTGVLTEIDAQRALGPLLPIRSTVPAGAVDVDERIRQRVTELPSGVLDLILQASSPEEIVKTLLLEISK